MKRLFLVLLAGGLLVTAAAFSSIKNAPSEFQIKQEEKNPWNNLQLNNSASEFQFVIVSDRTGGHRAKIFSRAVDQINLMQPEFVLSVGDLIEGGKKEPLKLQEEWKEFQGYIGKLQMPFFYVPGNHDVGNETTDKLWGEKFGRRYYHFVYRNVLFLMLNSEDPPGAGEGHFGDEQIKYAKSVLAENPNVNWTIVAMHKPVWAVANVEKSNFPEIEKALAGRPYTVVAGHRHNYKKYVRNGRNYYQFATTGGGSKLRGTRYGEFDHIVWVTMKKDGPIMANIMLDGIYPENLKLPESEEKGVARVTRAVHPVRGKVAFEGKPVADAHIVFQEQQSPDVQKPIRVDVYTEADGSYILTTYDRHDGAPVGEYTVTIVGEKPDPNNPDKPGLNVLPARYGKPNTSGLKVTVQKGPNEFNFELKK